MKSLFLWATLAVVPFGAAAVSVNNAGCPTCDCCGCCETGTCTCKAHLPPDSLSPLFRPKPWRIRPCLCPIRPMVDFSTGS